MSVTIRLSVTGKKHKKSYRIVAIHTRTRREAKPLEVLGFYTPYLNPPKIKLDQDLLQKWIKKGALVSDGVKKLLETAK